MSRRVVLVLAVVALVGVAAPGGLVGQAAAGNTTIEFHEALDEQERTSQVSATFTLQNNGTVTTPETMSGGGVEMVFQSWNLAGTSTGGGQVQGQGQAGQRYTVTYEVVAQRSAATQGGNYLEAANFVEDSQGTTYGQLGVTVYMRSPQFGPINDRSKDVVFQSSGSQDATVSVQVPNTGQGVMVLDSVEFQGVPSGISASSSSVPNRIGANGNGNFDVDLAVDPSVSEGTHTFDVIVHDNLGSTTDEAFEVTVDVVKAPKVSVGSIDVGDVLVGGSSSRQFTVSESLGFDGLDGVSVSGSTSGQYATIDFSGLSYVSTTPGGSDTAEVSVDVESGAPQHANLDWTLTFRPDDPQGVPDTATVQARVIYPAEFGDGGFDDTEFVFDEPRSSGGQSEEMTLSVPNSGDVAFDSVSASASASGISAQVVGTPGSLPGQSSRDVRVQLSADADVDEGSYPVEVRLSGGSSSGSDSRTYSTDVTVEHVPELDVGASSLAYGEVRVTQQVTESTDVAEVLGYETVSGLTVEQVSGPDEWLEVTRAPEGSLDAGEAAPFEVSLQFDTGAEVFQEYTWQFEIAGDGVETRTITVTATPKPVNFDRIRNPLADRAGGSGWQADAAGGMVTVLDTLEEKMKSDSEVAASDLSIAVAAGHSTTVFTDSAEAASDRLDEDNHTAAQGHLVRALAAYNVLDVYTQRLQDGELKGPARGTVDTAESRVSSLVADQTEYLEGRLDDDETSVLEQARINRQLARIESLRGNDERAAALRERSQDAFDRYIGLVDDASATRQDARRQWASMREETLTVVAGQPLVLNPASWDAFGSQSETLLATYDEAASTFEEAGADAEASSVAATRSERAGQLQVARYSLYGSTAVYGLGFFGLVGYLGRSTYRFYQDAEEVARGDFLVGG